jgi:hypothetical protein
LQVTLGEVAKKYFRHRSDRVNGLWGPLIDECDASSPSAPAESDRYRILNSNIGE